MKNKTKTAPQIKPAHTPESFAERYQALCKETGYQIVFEPRWVQSKDQGDYRLVIVASIAPMPKEEN
jgi:hypothetical protein